MKVFPKQNERFKLAEIGDAIGNNLHWEHDKVWEIKKYIALIVTKISFSQKVSNCSLKKRDTVNQLGARTVGVREKPQGEPVASGDIG